MSANREREILAQTYNDSAAVYRRVNGEKDPVTRQTRQEKTLVAADVKGAWSKTSSDHFKQSGSIGLASVDGVFFCDPEADIKLGDEVTVTTKPGDIFTLWAGRAMRYDSHAEVPLGGVVTG